MTSRSSAAWLVEHRMLVILVTGLALYVTFLGQRDLWYPDEPDIAEVCRAMYLSGDWVAPRRIGEIWIDYPPFLYWAGCVSSHLLGGMSEFSLRLPSAIGAIALLLAICAGVSRWFEPRVGFWSAIVLMTFATFADNAVAYRTDMLFSTAIGCGTIVYALGAGPGASWWPRIAGFALLGVAVLVKGPVGLLLPGLVLTLWHASRREWSLLFAMAPLTLVALAVAVPWYLACGNAMGFDAMWNEINAQNFQRFDEGGRGHIRPWPYYLERIWLNLAPWSPLLPFVLWWIARSEMRKHRIVQLALWWFGTWFVFWSMAVTKREVYLIPAYAPVAMLFGLWIDALGRSSEVVRAPDPRPARVFVGGFAVLLFVTGIGGVVWGIAAGPILDLAGVELSPLRKEVAEGLRVPGLVSGAIVTALSVWVWRARRRPVPEDGLLRVAATTVVVYALLIALLQPAFGPTKSYAEAGRWIRAEIGSADTIGILWPELGHHKMGAFGYYAGALVDLLETEADVERFFDRHPDSLVLVHESEAEVLLGSERTDWGSRKVRELIGGRYRYLVFRGA